MAGRKIKKGAKGSVTNYISRAQAIRKLQISLSGFRRLCILKGVYPRDPKNKKKVGKGSTAPKTYYFKKDIQFLQHEPILNTLREQKIFAKKINRAIAKHEYDAAQTIYENKPIFSLTHIIKERYPTFVDAIRDLDDCLSMVFLFSTMPSIQSVHAPQIQECQRLSAEFQHYVMWSHSLRKVFLSIKGIYYQAEIKGQEVTWIVPYQFSQNVPTDVDFKVMGTFLELYRVLLRFVNYKLYREAGLIYPPKIDEARENAAGGLAAFSLQKTDILGATAIDAKDSRSVMTKAERANLEKTEQRISSLRSKLAAIAARDAKNADKHEIDATNESNAETTDETQEETQESSIPEPIKAPENLDEVVPAMKELQANTASTNVYENLFAGCVFYLSREVPRYTIEFVVKAFGGKIGWDSILGGGSPIAEDDASITHHICDRPVLPASLKQYPRRAFVQPQFVFDCINTRTILNAARYEIGTALPPHLSPFVVAGEHDYVPEEANDLLFNTETARSVAIGSGIIPKDLPQGEEVHDETVADDDEDDEDGVEVILDEDASDEEEIEEGSDDDEIEAELMAEEEEENADEMVVEEAIEGAGKAGVALNKFMAAQNKKNNAVKPKKETKAQKQAREAEEKKELAKIMMSKKDRNLYNKIQHGINRKETRKAELTQRRKNLR